MSSKESVDLWMPLWIGDYISDTMHLNTKQHGAYFLLMMAYWRKKGPLEIKKIQGITKLNNSEFKQARPVLEEFFDKKKVPGKWYHGRIEREMRVAKNNREKLTKRGKAGARERWKGHKKSNA